MQIKVNLDWDWDEFSFKLKNLALRFGPAIKMGSGAHARLNADEASINISARCNRVTRSNHHHLP